MHTVKRKPRGKHATKTDEVQSDLTAPAVVSRYTVIESRDISIYFDGTWHRHGYSSHYGVGVAIDTDWFSHQCACGQQLLLFKISKGITYLPDNG